jgi:hypothetical protein
LRRATLITALLLFTASCLYVPWRFRVPPGNYTVSIGYGLLWTGPRYVWVEGRLPPNFVTPRATVDFGRLGLQLAALVAITTVAMLLAPKRPT